MLLCIIVAVQGFDNPFGPGGGGGVGVLPPVVGPEAGKLTLILVTSCNFSLL